MIFDDEDAHVTSRVASCLPSLVRANVLLLGALLFSTSWQVEVASLVVVFKQLSGIDVGEMELFVDRPDRRLVV